MTDDIAPEGFQYYIHRSKVSYTPTDAFAETLRQSSIRIGDLGKAAGLGPKTLSNALTKSEAHHRNLSGQATWAIAHVLAEKLDTPAAHLVETLFTKLPQTEERRLRRQRSRPTVKE